MTTPPSRSTRDVNLAANNAAAGDAAATTAAGRARSGSNQTGWFIVAVVAELLWLAFLSWRAMAVMTA